MYQFSSVKTAISINVVTEVNNEYNSHLLLISVTAANTPGCSILTQLFLSLRQTAVFCFV
jgi:hypothetical protein